MSNLKSLLEKDVKLIGKERLEKDVNTLQTLVYCEMISGKAIEEMSEADLYNANIKLACKSKEDIEKFDKTEVEARLTYRVNQYIEEEIQENRKIDRFGNIMRTFCVVSIIIGTIAACVAAFCPTLFI